jgi:hypothetical protein
MAKLRTKGEREHDMLLISELFTKGKSFREIAFEVNQQHGRNITHVTVFNDVKHILEVWKKDREKLIDYHKTIELEKINRLEKTYWEAWEKSIQSVKKSEVKKHGSPQSVDKVEKRDFEETGQGDPRYLDGVQWCIEQRCKILGINAPTKHDFQGNLFLELMKTATSEPE